MTDGVFLVVGHLGKRAVESFGSENRIVAESRFSRALSGNLSFDSTLEEQLSGGCGETDDGGETRLAVGVTV